MRWSESAVLRRWVLRRRGGWIYRAFDRCADRVLGMETRRVVDPENHGFDPAQASAYVPSDWWSVAAVLDHLPVRNGDKFLDLGCGKGRVLRLALRRPFSEVEGVELLPEVAEAARRNLKGRARVLTGDAREADIPEGNLWVFLFQPFSWEVTRQVMERLRDTACSRRQQVHVVYHSPIFHSLVLGMGGFFDVTTVHLPEDLRREYRVYEVGALG